MPGESDQVKWVGTRKVDPAIADLQAISDTFLTRSTFPGTTALVDHYMWLVAAGEMIRLKVFSATSDDATSRSLRPFIVSTGLFYFLETYTYAGAGNVAAVRVDAIAKEGDYIGVQWATTGGAGFTYEDIIVGYKIVPY